MPQVVYCHECQSYGEPKMEPVKPAADEAGFQDTDGSQIGMGRTVIQRCQKGHMLNLGTAAGMSGDLLRRG